LDRRLLDVRTVASGEGWGAEGRVEAHPAPGTSLTSSRLGWLQHPPFVFGMQSVHPLFSLRHSQDVRGSELHLAWREQLQHLGASKGCDSRRRLRGRGLREAPSSFPDEVRRRIEVVVVVVVFGGGRWFSATDSCVERSSEGAIFG